MEKTDSYGEDGQLWKRRTVMEKTGSYGEDGQLWRRRAVMQKTDSSGKEGQLRKDGRSSAVPEGETTNNTVESFSNIH